MSNRILILNQTLNNTFLDMYHSIINHYGSGTIITGFYDSVSDTSNINHIKSPEYSPKSLKSRFISWFKYLFFVLRWIRKNRCDYDLVFISTNPAIGPLLGLYFKYFRKTPYIVLVWDIYPNIIDESFNSIIIKPIIKAWHGMNRIIYRNAESVVTIGEIMANTIKKDYASDELCIETVPNWADTDHIKPIKKEENFFIEEQNLENKLIITYSGKMGIGHDLNTLLEAADKLHGHEDIVFLFIGHGPGYSLIKKVINEKKLKNVVLLPLQSAERFPYTIAAGDIGIVAQEEGLSHLFMPCKTYNLMAAGLAIIGISEGNNDLRNLLCTNEIGYNILPGDSEDLITKIITLKENKEQLKKFKENSRKLVLSEYNPTEIKNHYIRIFDKGLEK